ncbi:unnamed protein product, partial [Brassica rapa subsp. narinosa]
MSVHISACWPFPWTDPCTDFGQLMHHDAFGRDLCTCGLHFIGQYEILGGGSNLSDKGLNLSGSWQQGHSATYNTPSKGSIGHAFTVRIRTENQNQTSFYPFVPHEISVLVELILGHLRYLLTDVPPKPNSPPDNVLRPDRPAEASLGSNRRGCYPASDSRIGLESSSTGSSFPADSAKPVPLAVVSLDSRQGHRIPLVRTSSELAVRRPGKAPERAVPSPSPGRHEAVRSRHVSSSSSPPTVDGGCSPWRPDAVMSTTGRERHSVLWIFKGHRECTGHHATCGALPAAGPYLRLSRFQGMLTLEPFSEDQDRIAPLRIRPGRIAGPHPLPSRQFQALFDSLFKVLFIFTSRELGPGPSLRTLLQTTIRTPKTSNFQAGLFPSFWTGTSDYMTRIKFTTACQDASDVLSSDFGQPRAVTHGRSASVPYPREDGGTTICDTQADVPSARRLGAQLAF